MLKMRWLSGLVLVVSATLPACTTKTSLGREGENADSGRDTRPATGCTWAPVSVDLSCNDDPNLPTVAGSCGLDDTCTCRPGFVLNPTSKRCKLDPTSDAGVVICTVGADQTCNDDSWASWIAGTCVGGVACACKTEYLRNPATGRCTRAPVTDAGTDAPAGQVCTFLLDQTCNDDDTFSGMAGVCMKGGTCGCNNGFVLNPATGRCRAGEKPDAATTSDAPADSGAGLMCYWQKSGGMYVYNHFRFLLTTPDGQRQAFLKPDRLDAGAWPINDFQGQIVEKSGNRLTIDSCLTPATCQPSLYRFVLCDDSSRLECSATVEPNSFVLPPVGRRVRVVWHLENEISFCPGLYWLALYDAEPGPGQGSILFLASGGRKPGEAASFRNYLGDLPFSVGLEALKCAQRDAGLRGDDYRFVFSNRNGAGSALKLGTGENGVFEFTTGVSTQRLQAHCLAAVQPAATDDYWNWDFWMAGESTSTSVDAGSKDAPGVCTFGMNQTCNDEPWASWVAGTCQSDGTCVCQSGYVMNPSSGRCAYAPKDAGPDLTDSKAACTPGMDQTCNDSPAVSALWGTCQANGTCSCKDGYVINPSSGKCRPPEVSTCSGSYDACGCGCCGTPPAVCYYPSAGDSLSAIKSADEAVKSNTNCNLVGCALGQRYLCCVEATAEPAGSATYSASFAIGGYDRIGLKKTENDGNCIWLGLVSPSDSTSWRPLRVSTPTRWGIEGITAGPCSTGSTEQAIGAQGTVTLTPSGTSCALNAHMTVFFYAAASGTVTTKRIDADSVPGVPTGYCK